MSNRAFWNGFRRGVRQASTLAFFALIAYCAGAELYRLVVA